MIPTYEWAIKKLEYRFDTVRLDIVNQYDEPFLVLVTTITKPIFLDNNTIVPDSPIPSAAGVPLGHVLFPVIIIFTVTLSWPIKKTHAKILIGSQRILLAIPLSLLISLIDVPPQLLKIVWEDLDSLLNINISDDLPAFTVWSEFLNGGGLIALSIATSILILAISDSLGCSKSQNDLIKTK